MSCVLKSPIAIVVLGYNLREDFFQEIIKSRAEEAVNIYKCLKKMHDEVKIIFSGGDVANRGIEEATVMKNLAEYYSDYTIPSQDIIVETESKTTEENAKKVLEKVKGKGYKSFVLCTSDFHMERADFIFDCVFRGIKASFCSIGVITDSLVTGSVKKSKMFFVLNQKRGEEKKYLEEYIRKNSRCMARARVR